MVLFRRIALGFAGALVLISGASAQSLKEARARDAGERALEREAVYTRSICGNKLRVEIDWNAAGDWTQGLLISECDKALGAIEAACRAGDARAKSLERFVCAGDGKGASMSGRTFRYGASTDLDAFRATRQEIGGQVCVQC